MCCIEVRRKHIPLNCFCYFPNIMKKQTSVHRSQFLAQSIGRSRSSQPQIWSRRPFPPKSNVIVYVGMLGFILIINIIINKKHIYTLNLSIKNQPSVLIPIRHHFPVHIKDPGHERRSQKHFMSSAKFVDFLIIESFLDFYI
jgi:hypothetical protein